MRHPPALRGNPGLSAPMGSLSPYPSPLPASWAATRARSRSSSRTRSARSRSATSAVAPREGATACLPIKPLISAKVRAAAALAWGVVRSLFTMSIRTATVSSGPMPKRFVRRPPPWSSPPPWASCPCPGSGRALALGLGTLTGAGIKPSSTLALSRWRACDSRDWARALAVMVTRYAPKAWAGRDISGPTPVWAGRGPCVPHAGPGPMPRADRPASPRRAGAPAWRGPWVAGLPVAG